MNKSEQKTENAAHFGSTTSFVHVPSVPQDHVVF
jgi:hypothetical protein